MDQIEATNLAIAKPTQTDEGGAYEQGPCSNNTPMRLIYITKGFN
jgi:hypothetical protein